MNGFLRAGVGLNMGQDMMGRMEAIMNMYESNGGFNERSYAMSYNPAPISIDDEFSHEARFQPGYDDEEYQEYDTDIQPAGGQVDYDEFEKKLNEGTLDAPNLNLHQIPPSIFDNHTPITIIYLKDNHIFELPEYFFDELKSLAYLDLRGNKLTGLSPLNSRHESLRVMLLQGNQIRTLPYSLALAVNLRTIGLTGNPLTIPPDDIRKQGCKKMLSYLKQRMFMRVPMDETGALETLPSNLEDDEKLRRDLKKTASKRVIKSSSSLKPQSSNVSLNSKKKTDEEKKAERLKYTWELWKQIPYEGKSHLELFQKSLDEVRNQVLMKLNIQQEAILQKCKNQETLRKWRSETRMLQFKERPMEYSNPTITAPFGNDLNQSNSTISTPLRPEQFKKEVSECWEKLKEFASNPTSIADTELAMGRLKEVEEIQHRLMNMKLSIKSTQQLGM